MSACFPQTVTCPACGREQSVTLWQTINVTLNPELKADLLAWKLNRFTCAGCGHTALCETDLLYHDMTGRLLIALWPELAPPLRVPKFHPDFRRRLVRSRQELVEKVLIFDAGLDDRVLETLKCSMIEAAEPGTFNAADLDDLSTPLALFVSLGTHPEKGTPVMFFEIRDPPGGGCGVACELNGKLARFLDQQDATRRKEWGWDFVIDRAYGQEMWQRWQAAESA